MIILINKPILGLLPNDIIEINNSELRYYSYTHNYNSYERINFRCSPEQLLKSILQYGEELHEDLTKVSENPYIYPVNKTKEDLIDLIKTFVKDNITINLWLKIENLIPKYFYPYTSGVNYVFLSQSFGYKTKEHDFLEELGNNLKELLKNKVSWDNKVVIQCSLKVTRDDQVSISDIFIGKYDGVWKVGFGVWCDSYVSYINLNK